ncbi:copper transporter [Nocardioides sp.]|uniref:copper transporter n=1 Tax=Nocardioides sp. TaxID=35761 RepID=UPI0031FF076A|nr:hypothetical protein [Nocardioides sp.]
MITYRHHIVSLVAVFLALAIGVALGGGPLSDLGRDASATTSTAKEKTLDAKRAATFGDEFAVATGQTLYDGRLQDHPVAVLALPGADEDIVAALEQQIETAGGSVTGRYNVQKALVDPGEKSLVDALGSQLMTQLGAGVVDAETSTYTRIGQLVGVAVSTTQTTAEPVGSKATSIRQSLVGADLMTSPRGEVDVAPLVLVVMGSKSGGDQDQAVLSGILSGLAAKSAGAVVVADSAAGVNGSLAALRRQPAADEVTTVDGVESPLGQVTATLALLRALAGDGGSFGASGPDGAVPLG